jgi:hypothetical protein
MQLRFNENMRMLKMIILSGGAWVAIQAIIFACSWDNAIWPKDKRSDTPLFRFVIDGNAGYINASGQIVIPPTFPVFGNHGYDDFFEGVASMDILRPMLIDSLGAAIKFSPYDVSGFGHFSEGVIPASIGRGKLRKYGFVDHRGKLAIAATFDGANEFSERLAAVVVNGKYGYIDHAGDIVVAPRFNLAEPFSESAARVILDGPCNYVGYGPCAFFNPSILGFPEYRSGRDSHYTACQYTFIDRTGTPLFSQHFPDAFDFSEGLAAVGDGKRWGFIDRTGAFRIPLQFDFVGSFSDGLARFRRDGKWGFIDSAGRVVIPAQFDVADDFSSETAVVGTLRQRVWFIDKFGKKLFGMDYKSASPFRLGLAHVDNGEYLAYINRAGDRVFTYRPLSN